MLSRKHTREASLNTHLKNNIVWDHLSGYLLKHFFLQVQEFRFCQSLTPIVSKKHHRKDTDDAHPFARPLLVFAENLAHTICNEQKRIFPRHARPLAVKIVDIAKTYV